MKSREEIAKKYFPCTCGEIYLSRNLTAPDCPFHSLEWDKALEEYAQQSQPSGMRWVRASENPDPGKSKWYIVKTDTHAGRCYCGDKYAMSRYCIENKISMDDLFYLDESSPAGAAEGASEGMAEALRLKWINLTEDMGRLLSGQRGVSIDKLNKAMNLVQDFVNTMPASLSPGVEDKANGK